MKMQTHIPVFTEDESLEIEALPGENFNFLLEGDNLHSLYLLEKTHKGKIDLIYSLVVTACANGLNVEDFFLG